MSADQTRTTSRGRRTQRRAAERAARQSKRMDIPDHIRALAAQQDAAAERPLTSQEDF